MKNNFSIKDISIVSIILIILSLCLAALFIPGFENLSAASPILKRLKPTPWILILVPLWISYKVLGDLELKERLITILFLSLFTGFCVHLHFTNVELGNYFPDKVNIVWQMEVHEKILNKDPSIIPHSYRFLAETMISLLILWAGNFLKALILYRIVFQFLLLLSIFYWARLYVNYRTSIFTVLLYVLLYPITIRYYAGQPMDPISHLSFILSFIFMHQKKDFYFLLTVLIGILAKESIAIMPVFYFLFQSPKTKTHWIKSTVFIVLSFAVILSVRWYITQANLQYENISGVTPDHILNNLKDGFRWYGQFFFTIILLAPFTILGWRQTPIILKQLIVFLILGLVSTNLVFSWLAEVRNFVPFLVPMCLVSAVYFLKEEYSPLENANVNQ